MKTIYTFFRVNGVPFLQYGSKRAWTSSLNGWHKQLGHLTTKIDKNLIQKFYLPIVINKYLSTLYSSCSINKAHKQLFHPTILQSHAPLEIIYTDVWGPTHFTSIDSSHYYIILVNHDTKYMWFYPIVTKSSVSNIFPHFKKFVENRFQTKIKCLYSDNRVEFIALKSFLLLHGITHYITAPTHPTTK